MATDKSELLEVVNSGIDWQLRRIYWGLLDKSDSEEKSEFCWATVEHMVRAMHKMYQLNNKPIELHFNSPGGDVYDMLRLIDEIEASPCQIRFIGSGIIASAATWIMAVSDHRSLHKNTVVMLHDGHEGFIGSHTDTQIAASHNRQLQDRLYEVFAANSRMPTVFWQDLMQRDLYLRADEARMLGLCDEVIEPRKRGGVRKSRQAILANHPDPSELQKLTKELYKRIDRRKPPKLDISFKQEEVEDALVEDLKIDSET